jgi:hypothetical protein
MAETYYAGEIQNPHVVGSLALPHGGGEVFKKVGGVHHAVVRNEAVCLALRDARVRHGVALRQRGINEPPREAKEISRQTRRLLRRRVTERSRRKDAPMDRLETFSLFLSATDETRGKWKIKP